jgi:hypothetical protein
VRVDLAVSQHKTGIIQYLLAGFAVIGFFISRYLRFKLCVLLFYNSLESVKSGKRQSVNL